MTKALLPRAPGKSLPITLLTEKEFAAWIKSQPQRFAHWLDAQRVQGESRQFLRFAR